MDEQIANDHTDHATKSGSNVKGSTNTKLLMMAVVLGLLIIVAGVQAVELVSLKNRLSSDLSTLSVKGSSGSSGSLQKNLQNLPSMVGGC